MEKNLILIHFFLIKVLTFTYTIDIIKKIPNRKERKYRKMKTFIQNTNENIANNSNSISSIGFNCDENCVKINGIHFKDVYQW